MRCILRTSGYQSKLAVVDVASAVKHSCKVCVRDELLLQLLPVGGGFPGYFEAELTFRMGIIPRSWMELGLFWFVCFKLNLYL